MSTEPLTPILISGGGRSGTTLLMQVLGSSPSVAFDRVPPFEHRYLTFLLRTALLSEPAEDRPEGWDQGALTRLGDRLVGPLPFPGEWFDANRPFWKDMFLATWDAFGERARQEHPDATHYAEKTPPWVATRLDSVLPAIELIPIRDPRDVLASIVAFVERRGRDGFGMKAGEDPAEFARRLVPNQRSRLEAAIRVLGSDTGVVVRYEDLALDLAGAAAALGDRLGLDLDVTPVVAARAEFDRHMTSESPEASVGRWRRDLDPAIADLFAELGPLMAKVGYEL